MDISAVLGIMAAVAWLAAVGLVTLAFLQVGRGQHARPAVAGVAVLVIAAIALTSVSAGLVFINPDERGVVISAIASGGYQPNPLAPGLHWIVPFAESVVRYPISDQTYTMSIAPAEGVREGDDSVSARTADGQEVYVDASVIFAVDPAQVVQVHIRWQDRYAEGLVRAQARGIIRDAVSQYNVEEIITTKRLEMVDNVTAKLEEELQQNGLVLRSFILRNITFTTEYAASIEQKQIAEQQAKQAGLVIQQRVAEAEQARQKAQGEADSLVIAAQGRADSRLIEAKAEAEALNMLSEALKDHPELISYQYVVRLAPNVQVIIAPSNNPFVLPMLATPTPSITPGE
jgi:regulator of protease activity HflC (stomatin/prohibitin superfamily)